MPHAFNPRSRKPLSNKTSWQPVSDWYNASVGDSGHYYHQRVVLPQTLKILNLSEDSSLLDLGCGQGVLARHMPPSVYYQGLDVATGLIKYAKEHDEKNNHHFLVVDVNRESIPIKKADFTHATIILAIQNMKDSQNVFTNAFDHLAVGGRLVVVMNHPAFRIPRQTSWGIDDVKKTQYRRVDRYFSDLEIPITAHPGEKQSAITWSFHHPLSFYTQQLFKSGFLLEQIAEWNSDKVSVGKAAKMENRGRQEFPLFLTIVAIKK
ncbi:class I SAM-dependent methyltransferase [soil metagenome]